MPKRRLAGVAASGAIAGVAEAVTLLAIVHAAVTVASRDDTALLEAGPFELDLSVGATLAIAGTALAFRLAASWALARSVAGIGGSVLVSLRRRLLAAYLGADWPTQAAVPEGQLAELVSGHTLAFAQGATSVAAGVGSAAIFLTLLIAAFVVAPLVCGAVFVVLAVLLQFGRPLTGSVEPVARAHSASTVSLAGSLAELGTLTAEVAAFDLGQPVERRIGALVRDAGRRFAAVQFLQKFLPSLFQTLALAVVVGGLAVLNTTDRLDVTGAGAAVAIVIRALVATQPMQNTWQRLREMAPYVERLREEEARLGAAEVERSGLPVASVGRMELAEVTIRGGRDRPALDKVSFAIEPGELIGIIGPSGAGKTTLLQVLLRLRLPDAGSYLVDGRPAHDLDRAAWFGRVAFVPQDSHLLDGTVTDAVRFLRDDIEDAAIDEALRLAHVDHDVQRWPEGADTLVGPRSAWLSGGERQRISLARALAGRPDVLLLDEPTSALDARSEALVRETLAGLRGRVTTVVVAHRLSTLDVCDRILVLEAGRVAAFARSDVLAETSSFYREAVGGARPR